MSVPAARPDGERRVPDRPVPAASPPATSAPRTLADLSVGDRANVVRLEGAGITVQRLAEMGLTPGAGITVIRFAPLGDPVEVRVRGYALSLRKADARCVQVTPAEGAPSGARTP